MRFTKNLMTPTSFPLNRRRMQYASGLVSTSRKFVAHPRSLKDAQLERGGVIAVMYVSRRIMSDYEDAKIVLRADKVMA